MASKKDPKSKGKKLQVKKLKVTDLPAGKAADAKGGATYSCTQFGGTLSGASQILSGASQTQMLSR